MERRSLIKIGFRLHYITRAVSQQSIWAVVTKLGLPYFAFMMCSRDAYLMINIGVYFFIFFFFVEFILSSILLKSCLYYCIYSAALSVFMLEAPLTSTRIKIICIIWLVLKIALLSN